MEVIAGFALQALKHVLFSFVFFWPGCLMVKIVTAGRYPRSIYPCKADWLDYEALSFIGLITVVGCISLAAYVWR